MPPSTARFVDALLDGQLEPLLRKMRAEGASFDAIARTINTNIPDDCAVSWFTVRRYCIEYGIERGET